GANITGLGTLISGSYIGMEIGDSHKRTRQFTGLDTAPVVESKVPGRSFVLETEDLGSLDRGTPLYFRRLQVGEVTSYTMHPDGQKITVTVFVQSPYDKFVTTETRFWHASGIDVSLSATGLD